MRLYREYIQKSRVFLYPALGITSEYGKGIEPVKTYTSWGNIKHIDRKLICLYYLRDDMEFKKFERLRLLGHPGFCRFQEVEDHENRESGIYIFDFNQYLNGIPADFQVTTNGTRRIDNWNKLTEKKKRESSLIYSGVYNWDMFLKGSYSKLSEPLKKRIKDHYRRLTNGYAHVESYLHPDKYIGLYSEILGVSISTLKEVGELTDKPDLEKETLKLKVKSLKIKI